MTQKQKEIYIFAGVPYYDIGGGQRAAQLAKTFNKMGYLVHYIYAFESSETARKPVNIQAQSHLKLEEANLKEIARKTVDRPVFIFELPYHGFLPFLELGSKIKADMVYEHIDNWESSLGCLFYKREVLNEFLAKVDVITAVSKLLRLQLYKYIRENRCFSALRKMVYCPNAVDNELFDPVFAPPEKPKDLRKKKKTLLYYGSLWGDWFDWDLIRYVAKKHRKCSINLIGDNQTIKNKVKELPRNVHFLGLKVQQELPAYLHHSDMALLPFRTNESGKYVSPLKIYEYLALGKPVLSTKLAEVKSYPNVFSSDNAKTWARLVSRNIKTADTFAFTLQNSWYSRCSLLLKKMGEKQNPSEALSIIILNHNNKNIISKCIDSLLEFKKYYGYEIIVVDNVSTDGSYEMMEKLYRHKVKLVQNTKNGCSSGRNLGVQHSSGNFIIFLDSDQWAISEKWLDMPLKILEKDSSVAATGWAAGWWRCTTNNFPNRGIDFATLYRTDIGYLGTGGMVVGRNIFDAVEGFDENFDPTGYEDTDFCFKIKNLGYKLAYCPYMGIKHLPHQTTKAGSRDYRKLMDQNENYFLNKWKKLNPQLLEEFYLK